MDQSLIHLGFGSIDEVTTSSLRNAFKHYAALSHPDKGGSEEDFERVLASYLHLSSILRRQTGGRDGNVVLHASDVREARDTQFVRELNNMVNEVYDDMEHTNTSEDLKRFNEAFERLHIKTEDSKGYDEWFRSNDSSIATCGSSIATCGSSTATCDSMEIEPLKIEDFNKHFEETIKTTKPLPTTLTLHLDEMAYFGSRYHGTSILPSTSGYYSDPTTNPEYTDLYAAYTSENIIMDKIPSLSTVRTIDDLMKEREMINEPQRNDELEAIAAYEKRKQMDEEIHKEKMKQFFASTASSQWALHNNLA